MEISKYEEATALMFDIQLLTEKKERLKAMIEETDKDHPFKYNIRVWSEEKRGISVDIPPCYARSLLKDQLTIVESDIRNKEQQFKEI